MRINSTDMNDRVAIVTGGTSGIGLATVHELSAQGMYVVVAGIEEKAGQRIAAAICSEKSRDAVQFIKTDVTIPSEIVEMVALTASRYGRLDVLVNNAGIGAFGETPDLPLEQWNRVMDINLNSVFHTCKAAIPLMRKNGGGAVVNVASVSGMAGDYGFTAYAASKGGLINYTRALALDHARDRIRVNAVCPGLIETPLTAGTFAMDELREMWFNNVPLGRAGQPNEVARLIRFLVSNEASYMTGAVIPVDGGITAWTGQPNMPRLFGKQQ